MDKGNKTREAFTEEDILPESEAEAKAGGPIITPASQQDPDAPRGQPDPTPIFGGLPGDPPPAQSLFPEHRPPAPGQPLPAEEPSPPADGEEKKD